ncbi:GDSL esterase/lipase At5g55050 [Helianthus annuus]|uniref:GDSL esterase/lipase At5g55050 n=1 Tax=Helianthus annuus TaxID=4232 RepID=UPI000B8F5969|nr:GDSL esterase/lipase At5g55050 [Helianthus annuus]
MAASINLIITSSFLCVLLFESGGLCESDVLHIETYAITELDVPGLYIFGDSLVDFGNNNYLDTLARANFPYNGIDFPTGPTGRFCNGKNVADFLAEKVGLPSPPPYLSLVSESKNLSSTNATVTGVSFASGGSGVFNGSEALDPSTISLPEQVDYYSLVYDQLVQQLGLDGTRTHLAKSLFLLVIGSNDLFNYFNIDSKLPAQYTVQQYVDRMVSTLKPLLKQMYGLGARKFVVSGVGVIGCCPAQRKPNNNSECNLEANYGSTTYNDGLKALLNELKLESSDMHYTYFDTYNVMSDLIQRPETYGITEIKEACCGRGNLKADVPCVQWFGADYCPNRKDHLFWDLYHPTESTYNIFASFLYNGSQQVTTPMNVEQLVNI